MKEHRKLEDAETTKESIRMMERRMKLKRPATHAGTQ